MVFRADAGQQIGAGHVMRLIAIAEEAISRGIDCCFVGEIREVNWLHSYIHSVGFSQILDPEAIAAVMGEDSVLLIDSYEISVDDPSLNSENWNCIISITDALTPEYEADLVIRPGLVDESSTHHNPSILSGPEVIPFRKAIGRHDNFSFSSSPRLLIFGGGTDYFGMAPRIANILQHIQDFQKANFIYHDSQEIETMDSRFEVFPFGLELDSMIEQADIVITSASTSSFEVLARGIPTGIIRLVGNQDENFQVLDDAGLVTPVGKRDDSGVWIFFEKDLNKLICDTEYRKVLSQKNQEVFDFQGSSRILDGIISMFRQIQ